jgi:hypothetical protein
MDKTQGIALKLAREVLRFNRRVGKTFSAIKEIEEIGLLESERLKHNKTLLAHTCARINLDLAEALQELELAECTRLDRLLRKIEAKNTNQ